jgi:CRISPR-associated protein Cas1
MSWFGFARRAPQPGSMLPAVAAPVAHVIGPGMLSIDSGRLVHADEDGDRQATVLIEGLELVACHGRVSITPDCLAALAEAGVAVAFLSSSGAKLLARLTPEDDPRLIGRVMQHRVLADESQRSAIARGIVAEKIRSQAGAARHYQRQGKPVKGEDLKKLATLEERAGEASSLDELLGLEGAASAAWFSVFAKLLVKPWEFPTRSRRPPLDPGNAVLSLGYTMLYQRVVAACQAIGLEPGLGALHAYRAGRQSLACDLMEPLRVPVVDRWAVGLLNQRRVSPDDFLATDGEGVRLTKGAFPRVLADWERQWNDTRSASIVMDRVRAFAHDLRTRGGSPIRMKRELAAVGIDELA